MAKKRRFGKKLTAFRDAVKKLHTDHRVPHVVTVLGEAMGLTVEKINEEIGLASAMFGHLATFAERTKHAPREVKWCDDLNCASASVKHTHGGY